MTITKTTVTHQLISPSASVVQRSGIIRLGGFVGGQWRDIEGMSADGQVISWEPANADGAGAWSVDLIPNADITSVANTLYRYMPAQGQAVVFQVPQGGVTKTLKELVVTDPAQWPSLTPTTIGPAGRDGDSALTAPFTANISGAYTLDITKPVQLLTITGATTITMPPVPTTLTVPLTVIIQQNIAGGNAVTLPTAASTPKCWWAQGIPPTLDTTANARHWLYFVGAPGLDWTGFTSALKVG